MDLYREERVRLGRPIPDEVPIRREVFCARTHDEAVTMAAPYIKGMYDLYKAWGQDKAMAKGDQDITQEYEGLARDRFIVGTPDEVAEEIVRYQVGMPQGQVLDTFELLAAEVFPKVRAAL